MPAPIAVHEPLAPGIHHLWPSVPVHVFSGAAPGPTAVVQGGIHGDEVAGVHALQELLEEGLAPQRGKVIVIPVMNPRAYRVRTRAAPDGFDLNRCFPGSADAPALEHRLAHAFLSLVRAERPALVATLHESRTRYDPDRQPSFGQTLVYGVRPVPPVLERVVAGLNQTLSCEEERWSTHYYPVSTSSTEVIVEEVGCVGTCVETWMSFPERRRIDMQKEVVRRLLDAFGILPLE